MPGQALTIGRIVHWVTKSGTHRPAVITSVAAWEEYGTINLVVFGGKYNGVEMKDVPYNSGVPDPVTGDLGSKNFESGTWHWPERNDA